MYLLPAFASSQNTRYIRAGATGDGSSWQNASGDLQQMINESSTVLGDIILVDTIKVGAGTYYPNRRIDNLNLITPNDRVNAFSLKSGVKIFGGYPADGNGPRNPDANHTILSGDIGVPNNLNDNTFHVVFAFAVDTTTLLDGFTIEHGYANQNEFTVLASIDVAHYIGAGIYAFHARMTLKNMIIRNNTTTTSGVGGGIYCRESPLIIDNTRIEFNSSGEGGGMYNTFNSNIKMTNSYISGNSAAIGSATKNQYSQVHYANMLIIGNFTGGDSHLYAAMNFNSCSQATITNVTISSNHSGGIHSAATSLIIRNSIVFGNKFGLQSYYIDPFITHSLVQEFTDYDLGGINNLNPFANPHFYNAKHYSEAPFIEGDYKLLGISPAINSGSNEFLSNNQNPDLSNLQLDLNLEPRIMGSSIDMGAYEFQFPCIETHHVWHVDAGIANSGNGKTWSEAFKTLGEALYNSSLCGLPDSILVAEGTYKPDRKANEQVNINPENRFNSFVLLPNVKLLGGYPSGGGNRDPNILISILSGDLGAPDQMDDNAYHVVVVASSTGSGVLDGFTITRGNANNTYEHVFVNGELANGGYGGGILSQNANIRLNNLRIFENNAWVGGGISNFSTNTVYNQLDIRGNTAGGGGGINNNYSNSIIINSNISGNFSNYGGGILNNGLATMMLINVTLAGNKGSEETAVIYNVDSSKISVVNSIITQNSGGIYNDPGLPGHMGKSKTRASYSLIQGFGASDSLHILDGLTDPKFIEPVNFEAAPTLNGNLQLQKESAAINYGNASVFAPGMVPDISAFTTDLSGNSRISGVSIDLGAYEYDSFNSEELCVESTIQLKAGIEGSGYSYQWQIDEGNGYTEVEDDIYYTGSSAAILNIKNIPGTFYGYKYRCVINGGQAYSKVYTIKFRNEWLGLVDNNWNNAANWSCGSLPNQNTDVIVNSGSLILNSNVIIRSLIAQPGASITVSPGNILTITN